MNTTQKMNSVLLGALSLSLIAGSFAPQTFRSAQAAPAQSPLPADGGVRDPNKENEKAAREAMLAQEAKLRASLAKLAERVDNGRGGTVSTMLAPSEVLDILYEAEKAISRPEFQALRDAYLMRDIYVSAITTLYRGRGQTDTSKGWYPLNRKGHTGLEEIAKVLEKPVLDAQAKKALILELEQFDAAAPELKKTVGFPPQMAISDAATRAKVIGLIEAAPVRSAYQPMPKLGEGEGRSVAQLMDDANISGDERMVLGKFLSAIEDNLYDKSIAILNDPNKRFVEYYGRETELAMLIDAASRIEKGHALITGKAGVGKTTLLKMLSDGFVQGSLRIRNEPSPIVLELSIVDVTNQQDPTVIKVRIAAAQLLAKRLNRRVILYVDEAHVSSEIVRNAVKSFLTQKLTKEENQVSLVMSTTAGEARDFLSDSAFSRRFVQIFTPEFNQPETLELIRRAYLPLWKSFHRTPELAFAGISDEAFDYAYNNALFEQPHAGNPTGTKEILEATIVRQLRQRSVRGETGEFIIEPHDIREYLKAALNIELLPGDPAFDEIFERKWAEFKKEYRGNEGALLDVKRILKGHFAQLNQRKMDATIDFGPPGGGKTFLTELVAKYFFKGALLTINGAEFKNGGLELNKLIGSPPGTVGSEEQRSMLSKFMADNPAGGVIKIEEADYMHHDVVQLLTNMITDRKFIDGLGKEWRTGQFVIMANSNIGQELMIPSDAANAMNWDQYETRRRQLVETVEVDGQIIERVRAEKIAMVFDRFIHQIVTKSNPDGDTSEVAQEANKQRRRYTPLYILPPGRRELVEATASKVQSYIDRARKDFNVTLEINPQGLESIVDIEHYDFTKGFSYVDERLESRLFGALDGYLNRRGEKVSVRIEESEVVIDGIAKKRPEVVVTTADETRRFPVEVKLRNVSNPWYDSPEMREKITHLAERMRRTLRANNAQIEQTKDLLKSKMQNWAVRAVITQLGTSGNGKTEFFKALAVSLFDDEGALFKISGLNNKFQLANFFRPPTGIQGGREETQFERWFKSRMNSGGGVILLDELLSFNGLTPHEVAGKVEVINELYDLLDEGQLRIGNKVYDARGFVVGITGNAMQEVFKGIGDDPDSERLVKEVVKRITRDDIVKYFSNLGVDAPKVARFGRIFVNGPLPRDEAQAIGAIKINRALESIRANLGPHAELSVDPAIAQELVTKLTTLELGMREVETGFKRLIQEPLDGIFLDIAGARKAEAKRDMDGKIHWYVNGDEVVLEGRVLDSSGVQERSWVYLKNLTPGALVRTPQMTDLELPKKTLFSPESIRAIAVHEVYGHWMVNVLLKGTNDSEAISLIPGDGYAGYVRGKIHEIEDLTTLRTILEELVMLQAGHRAVFLASGMYAVGGGPGALPDPKDKKRRSDDIGKAKALYERVISNQLLDDYGEISPAKSQGLVKLWLKALAVAMADDLIRPALKSKTFEPVFERVVRERFISGRDLDGWIEVNQASIGDPGTHLVSALSGALQRVWPQYRGSEKREIAKLSRELFQKVTEELLVAQPGNAALNARVVDETAKLDSLLSGASCNKDLTEK